MLGDEICSNCFRRLGKHEHQIDDAGECQDCGMGMSMEDAHSIMETHEKLMDGMGSREDQEAMIAYFKEKNGRYPTYKEERDFFPVYLNIKKSGAI